MNMALARGARTSRLAALAICCLLSAGLGGCTDSNRDDDAGPSASTPGPPETGKDVVSGNTGDLKHPQGAIDALSEFTCEAGRDGSWSAKGTLTNTSKSQTRYLVSVSVIKSQTSEVLGSAEKTYTLKPQEHRDLAMDDIYNKAREGMECVPRVVSGT